MLSDYQTDVTDLVRDDNSEISSTQLDDAIGDAVIKYSNDKPRTLVEDVVSDGTVYLDLPASWEQEFSEVLKLEYPIGSSPLTYIDEFEIYQSPSEFKILLPNTITASASVRVSFTAKHSVTAVLDTVPTKHREPVACYAAALLLMQLASVYSGDEDSTIAADNVDHGDKAGRFSSRAKDLKKQYHDLLGIDKKRTQAASATANWNRNNSTGKPRLFHDGNN